MVRCAGDIQSEPFFFEARALQEKMTFLPRVGVIILGNTGEGT
jgi:hypothetical protein